MRLQLIPRGSLHAAGEVLPPHFIGKVDDERWAIYVPIEPGSTHMALAAEGAEIADAYQAWVDTLGVRALVFEEPVSDGWVKLRFEDLRMLGL